MAGQPWFRVGSAASVRSGGAGSKGDFVKLSRSSIVGAVLVGLIASGMSFASPASSAAATPPWEPDPQSNGTLSFFNAAGTQISGGNDLTHLFAYAEASSAEDPAGFHKAAVYFAFPDHLQPTSSWFVQNASAATTYPNASAPAPVNSFTNPVSSPGANDANLTAALGAGVLDGTAGYANLIQVRLVQSGGAGYWAADISYDTASGTWAQVYPAVATVTSTSTTLGAAPAGHQAPAGNVDLTATVSPAAAVGSVQFSVDGSPLGSAVAVAGGTATMSTTALTTGSHSITAAFTPTNPAAFAPSTSSALTYLVGTAPAAPTGVIGSPATASATVSWAVPGDTGGLPLVGYDVQYSSNGGATWTPASPAFHTSTATTQVVGGLTNGVSYQFHVAAINAIGTGAYSATSGTVVPIARTTALVQGRSAAIRYGSASTVSAKLTDATTGAAVVGAPLTVMVRPAGASAFTPLTSVATNGAGVASLVVRPTSTTQYQFAFAGDAALAASTSGVQGVTVVQTVALKAAPARVRHGVAAKLWGTVSPSRAGQIVYIKQKVGRTWRTIAKVRIVRQKLPNGRVGVGFVLKVTPRSAGRYYYQAVGAATAANASGASSIVTLIAS